MSILSTPYSPAQNALLPLTRYAAVLSQVAAHVRSLKINLPRQHGSMHKLIVDQWVWLIAFLSNDCESRFDYVCSGLLDMRTVAGSDADKHYVFDDIDPPYLAKMLKYTAYYIF